MQRIIITLYMLHIDLHITNFSYTNCLMYQDIPDTPCTTVASTLLNCVFLHKEELKLNEKSENE